MSQSEGPSHAIKAAHELAAATALAHVEADLRDRAFLHDDPGAYRAGIRDALQEVAAAPTGDRAEDAATGS